MINNVAAGGQLRTVEGMKCSMLRTERSTTGSARGRRRRTRGAQLLEFAITLPLFLFMLMFSLDLGRMVFMSGLIHDAAFTSARAGAQIGGAGSATTGASRKAFNEVVSNYGWKGTDATYKVVSGATCAKAANSADNFVAVDVSYKVFFITPGLNSLLGVLRGGPTASDGSWTLKATGLARCEITKS
jgi:Flp pilus assembly protein TadG